MINKPWDKIMKEDIERLVTEAVAESNTLDYKQELPNDSPQSTLNFLSDVAAFANASGGDLIFGIREKREAGKPTAIPDGFERLKPRGTWDETKRRLESIIRTGIEPTLAIKIDHFDGLPEGPVLVVRVPASWAGPHMVTSYGKDTLRPQFYKRHNGGNHPMDIDEIRAAFTLSEGRFERLRRFRSGRLGLITGRDESIPAINLAGPRFVLHVLPVSSFDLLGIVDISRFAGRVWGPSPAFNYSEQRRTRFNVEGYLILDFSEFNHEMFAYTQIFRSGAIETVKVLSDNYIDNNFEWLIIKHVEEFLRIQQEMDVQTPVLVMLTLSGVKGLPLIPPPNTPRPPNRFDRDLIFLPECVIDDFDASVAIALRDTFDALYQAAGAPRSPNYDLRGEWIGVMPK
jgi:hypothetical protein